MWSFFSKSVLPDYEIGDVVENSLSYRSLWTLKQGRNKKLNTLVSVFVGDAKNRHCRNALQRIKTLKHPNILPYITHAETEKELYIISRPVLPAARYLQQFRNESDKELLYALVSVAQALRFLNVDASLFHNAVQLGAVYVCNKSNQNDYGYAWYLWDLDYCCENAQSSELPVGVLDIFSPTENANITCGDSWGLGCLMWELYNFPCKTEFNPKCLLDTSKLSSQVLIALYKKLMASRSSQRISVSRFLDEIDKRQLPDNDKICRLFKLLNSESLLTQNNIERRRIIGNVEKMLDSIPNHLQIAGVIPLLTNRLRPIADISSDLQILPLLFRIGELMTPEEYSQLLIPTLISMYYSSDRALRVELLLHLDKYVEYLDSDVINKDLYQVIARGMLDTHPLVRETTLRSFLLLAPKLLSYTLNNDLIKLLSLTHARDPIGSVRTNTIILLVNLMPLLDVNKRGGILSGALCRALQDQFKPARDAAVAAVTKSLVYLNIDHISKTLLPALCPLLVDDRSDEIFKVIREVINYLENDNSTSGQHKDGMNNESIRDTSLKASWSKFALSLFVKEKPQLTASSLQHLSNEIDTNNNLDSNALQLNHSNVVKKEDAEPNEDKVYTPSVIVSRKPGKLLPQDCGNSRSKLSEDIIDVDIKTTPMMVAINNNDVVLNQNESKRNDENDFFESMLREERQKKKPGKRLGGSRIKS
ncbi:hypothetical protein GJ496_003415 [Pomphorhynchus laevis]|nr:hypothetical protein GJ496_003415 [Pomphorhynchus laevis]